jgi:Zn-finger nucleic acid-binding protein
VQQGVQPRQLDRKLLVATLKRQGAVLDRAERDALMENLRLPDGTSFRQYFNRRQAELRDHWEKRGYKFSFAGAKQQVVGIGADTPHFV